MTRPTHSSRSFYRRLKQLGLEFWLPLPCLAIAFWVGGSILTSHVLSRPYDTENKLQADTNLEIRFAVGVSFIQAIVNRAEGISQVEIRTTDSVLKRLEFEFPVTDVSQLEVLIAEELDLSLNEVRRLVRYEIINE
ncbi:hypothetical protein IQ268_17835 [Oculatella sp. LEGE 06141]|uniref:hypothetical protein n=1 Tax=Oculatella sp. LEGE 06141 TaxID=1828648 RepID=UPI0018815AD0|nr:hypothetical protein [Oculatella sp. LEGE 06141]MBE9180425.1 hypothetical protein [Oculatella sp. LEGE 06141]